MHHAEYHTQHSGRMAYILDAINNCIFKNCTDFVGKIENHELLTLIDGEVDISIVETWFEDIPVPDSTVAIHPRLFTLTL